MGSMSSNIEKIDDYTLRFTLPTSNVTFLPSTTLAYLATLSL